ncbi:MAG: hypothetical protein HUU55_04205 [Myxococcales bacterium]|nr:hypothetical protein [Myxococcales bacterium]
MVLIPESQCNNDPKLSRRRFIGRVTAIVLGSVSVPIVVRTLESGPRRSPITWAVRYAAFEQTVNLRLSRQLRDFKSISVVLTTPRESLLLDRFVLRPGESQAVHLAYPYQEIVPGDYAYQACLDDDSAGNSAVKLAITLYPYRFGC